MAGQAAKKRSKLSAEYSTYYQAATGVVTAWFVLFRCLWQWSSFTLLPICLSGFAYVVVSVTLNGILSGLCLGVATTYYNDIFLVTLLTLLAASFSNYGWFLWLSIPAFAVYKIIKLLLDWVFTPEAGDGPEDAKKRAKLERRMKAGGQARYSTRR
eukprot:GHVT01064692.1.p1 GENE.GHVT01064692.1~~GHVT01064692.1.p1  ORF type:complete len:156 (+),score=30.16 GHVT01064692.1:234-701(+)